MTPVLSIPKNFTHGEELVVLARQDYERLKKQLSELADAFEKIRRGEKELKEGKTRTVKSLIELRSH